MHYFNAIRKYNETNLAIDVLYGDDDDEDHTFRFPVINLLLHKTYVFSTSFSIAVMTA